MRLLSVAIRRMGEAKAMGCSAYARARLVFRREFRSDWGEFLAAQGCGLISSRSYIPCHLLTFDLGRLQSAAGNSSHSALTPEVLASTLTGIQASSSYICDIAGGGGTAREQIGERIQYLVPPQAE